MICSQSQASGYTRSRERWVSLNQDRLFMTLLRNMEMVIRKPSAQWPRWLQFNHMVLVMVACNGWKLWLSKVWNAFRGKKLGMRTWCGKMAQLDMVFTKKKKKSFEREALNLSSWFFFLINQRVQFCLIEESFHRKILLFLLFSKCIRACMHF